MQHYDAADMSDTGAAKKHLDVRKYPNRRYYDSTHSRHLTIEEIRSLIRDGYDITVTDSKTGADITAQVLTQIILELETPKVDTLPVALLLRMIRSNDQMVRDFVENYFNQAFAAYVDYQKQMGERMRQMPAMTGLFPPFAPWAHGMAGKFTGEPPPASPEPPKSSASQPESGAAAPKSELHDAVAELQQQLASLKAQLGGTKPSARKKK